MLNDLLKIQLVKSRLWEILGQTVQFLQQTHYKKQKAGGVIYRLKEIEEIY